MNLGKRPIPPIRKSPSRSFFFVCSFQATQLIFTFRRVLLVLRMLIRLSLSMMPRWGRVPVKVVTVGDWENVSRLLGLAWPFERLFWVSSPIWYQLLNLVSKRSLDENILDHFWFLLFCFFFLPHHHNYFAAQSPPTKGKSGRPEERECLLYWRDHGSHASDRSHSVYNTRNHRQGVSLSLFFGIFLCVDSSLFLHTSPG